MSDYNTIKEDLAKLFGNLEETDLIRMIPSFIEWAEARISRIVRIPVMEVVTTLTTDGTNGRIAIPLNFLEMKHLVMETADGPEAILKRPWRNVKERQVDVGRPQIWARRNDEIMFAPVPDAATDIEIYFYVQLANLTPAAPDNFFSNNTPEILIMGALLEAGPFMKNVEPDMVDRWSAKFDRIVAELHKQRDDDDWGGSDLSVRLR